MDTSGLFNFVNELTNRLCQYENRINQLECRLNVLEGRQITDNIVLDNRVSFLERHIGLHPEQVAHVEQVAQVGEQTEGIVLTSSSGQPGGLMTFSYEGSTSDMLFTQFSNDGEQWGNFEAPFTPVNGSITRPFVPHEMKFVRLVKLQGGNVVSNVYQF